MEYFCKYLSIGYPASASPSHGDRNSGEDGFLYIDWTAVLSGGAPGVLVPGSMAGSARGATLQRRAASVGSSRGAGTMAHGDSTSLTMLPADERSGGMVGRRVTSA